MHQLVDADQRRAAARRTGRPAAPGAHAAPPRSGRARRSSARSRSAASAAEVAVAGGGRAHGPPRSAPAGRRSSRSRIDVAQPAASPGCAPRNRPRPGRRRSRPAAGRRRRSPVGASQVGVDAGARRAVRRTGAASAADGATEVVGPPHAAVGGKHGRACGSGRELRAALAATRRRGSRGRHGCACAAGSRASSPDGGCSAGRCACSRRLQGARSQRTCDTRDSTNGAGLPTRRHRQPRARERRDASTQPRPTLDRTTVRRRPGRGQTAGSAEHATAVPADARTRSADACRDESTVNLDARRPRRISSATRRGEPRTDLGTVALASACAPRSLASPASRRATVRLRRRLFTACGRLCGQMIAPAIARPNGRECHRGRGDDRPRRPSGTRTRRRPRRRERPARPSASSCG